jgi:hypothetical protein
MVVNFRSKLLHTGMQFRFAEQGPHFGSVSFSLVNRGSARRSLHIILVAGKLGGLRRVCSQSELQRMLALKLADQTT